jgi:CO/xanthine dehydrogenase FAD-binding subunit
MAFMTVLAPHSLDEARTALAEHPDAHVLAGGTDLMVEVNSGHRRPNAILSLRHVRELRQRQHHPQHLLIGAGTTYTDLAATDIASTLPALAAAARTVGSPQIRNAGTLGGNVGTGSPAGDTLPVLAALDASIDLLATDGTTRSVPWHKFFVGPKRTTRKPDELIVSVNIPLHDTRQDYLKVGTRNAMVISVAGVALVVDRTDRTVRCGLGSVGPVPLRAYEAENWVRDRIDWDSLSIDDPTTYETFGSMVGDAAKPISDQRSTADYRRHAVCVLARRALQRLIP